MGTEFFLQGGMMKMFWNGILVMVAQCCEYTKNHRIVYFKKVNLRVCEL